VPSFAVAFSFCSNAGAQAASKPARTSGGKRRFMMLTFHSWSARPAMDMSTVTPHFSSSMIK
jgi:hypothetical protein